MIVTDIFAADEEYTPEAARDALAVYKSDVKLTSKAKKQGEVLDQLRILSGLCNCGEFDAATLHLPLHERRLVGDATDQAVLRLSPCH